MRKKHRINRGYIFTSDYEDTKVVKGKTINKVEFQLQQLIVNHNLVKV